ncbi:MAG: hypothetical protein ABI700_14495 [Chloroflexota bacterium]
MRTGERIAFLTSNDKPYGNCSYWGCNFSHSADRRYLYIYGDNALGQYDFLTLQGVQVDVDNLGSISNGYPTATSPDGRYLVVANDDFRVWDVAHLPSDFNTRDPVITFSEPKGRAAKIAFTDDTTVVVTTVYGEVSSWNIETGQQIMQ